MTDKKLSQRVKEYFAQIRKTNRLIQRLTDIVNAPRSGLTSQSYELKPGKVQTSGPRGTLGETIVKIMSFKNDINTWIDEPVTMKKEAFNMISKVPDLDQQNVLVSRYIQLKKWEDLAAEFEYTTQWLFEIHGKALLAFTRKNADFLKEPSKVQFYLLRVWCFLGYHIE